MKRMCILAVLASLAVTAMAVDSYIISGYPAANVSVSDVSSAGSVTSGALAEPSAAEAMDCRWYSRLWDDNSVEFNSRAPIGLRIVFR